MIYFDNTLSGNDYIQTYSEETESQNIEVSVSIDSSSLEDIAYSEPLNFEIVSLCLLGAILGSLLSYVLFRRFK